MKKKIILFSSNNEGIGRKVKISPNGLPGGTPNSLGT